MDLGLHANFDRSGRPGRRAPDRIQPAGCDGVQIGRSLRGEPCDPSGGQARDDPQEIRIRSQAPDQLDRRADTGFDVDEQKHAPEVHRQVGRIGISVRRSEPFAESRTCASILATSPSSSSYRL